MTVSHARLFSGAPALADRAARLDGPSAGERDGRTEPGVEVGTGRERRRIASVSNPLVKHCVKLRLSSSYRQSCASAIVVGLTPIMEISRFQKMNNDDFSSVDCLFLLDGVETPDGFQDLPSVVHVSPHVMKKLTGIQSVDSTEAIAIMKTPTSFYDMSGKEEEEMCQTCFSSPCRILVLDGIQDPGNLGTLLRSAMAFKWDGVFLLPGCCDPFNEKALRAARGASFQLPIVSGNWFHLHSLSTQFEMKLLAGHPENCNEGSKDSKRSYLLSRELADSLAGKCLCLVLGSEGHGLSEQTMQACELVSIPMAGMFESLNVSVADLALWCYDDCGARISAVKIMGKCLFPKTICSLSKGAGDTAGQV